MHLVSKSFSFSLSLCLLLAASCLSPAATTAQPDAISADGGRYYGPLVDGLRQGQGRIEWSNGARYEGDFDKGVFYGKGRWESGSGEVYEGDFANGMKSGTGRMTRAGAIYVGEFHGDEFNGQGRYEFANGDVYEGEFANGLFQGPGKFVRSGETYRGGFRLGVFWGQGELVYTDGRTYRGAFEQGHFKGKGRYETPSGEVYEGDFDQDDFTGNGTYRHNDGALHEGGFLKWRAQGPGTYTDPSGNVYTGNFVNGDLTGAGKATRKDGTRYEGEFKHWLPDGQGVMHLPSGDVYKGTFAFGSFNGEGTLTYATPRADGRTQETGVWQRGHLQDTARGERSKAKANVEVALYTQLGLLDKSISALSPRDPNEINLYLLAIAGDGTEEVFRREVEFVRDQFDSRFGTRGHSLVLINSRNTVELAPMATITSIKKSVNAIAARMDPEKDILFLFLTSHGSQQHELTLDLAGMDLPELSAPELGKLIKTAGVRWKVVVISACYAGGFIDELKDGRTLIIAAARKDRRSFGCADENDFTYFGRAFFKEALPQSTSFQDAFRKAEALVSEWEAKDQRAADKPDAEERSLPQMENPPEIADYLRQWWKQAETDRSGNSVRVKTQP